MVELARTGLIPEAGHYKDHPLYDGRALETFTDTTALQRAIDRGRLFTTDQAAAHLRIRRVDFTYLAAAGWIQPVAHARGPYQSRRSHPSVPLYRAADLDVLAGHPGIDWEAIRATPPGRPSPLARLSTPPRP